MDNNSSTSSSQYRNGFQYTDGALDFFPTAEGYVKVLNSGNTQKYHYVYNFTDHLGNIRLKYTLHPQTNVLSILEEDHYYPYGYCLDHGRAAHALRVSADQIPRRSSTHSADH